MQKSKGLLCSFRPLLLTFLTILLLSINSLVLASEDQEQVYLTILSVNDFHGALADKGPGKDPGAAGLATFIQQERAKNPTGTLLLSAGDMFQGTVDSNLLYGKPVLAMMNALAFDALSIGNHEFDWGIPALTKLKENSRFPWGGANIRLQEEIPAFALPYPNTNQPFMIVTKDHLKIAIIPLTTPETTTKTNPRIVKDYSFENPATTVKNLLPAIKQSGADLVILLGHIGSVQDNTGRITGEAADLANALPKNAVAAIVTGHTHLVVAGSVNEIPIVQAGYRGQHVGEIRLTYSKKEKRVVAAQEETFDLTKLSLTPDPTVKTIVRTYEAQIAATKKQVIGQIGAPMVHERYHPSVSLMGQWVTDAMRQATGSDVAFQNGGGLRASFATGPITLGNLYEVLPFHNTLSTMELTGREIRQILSYGILNSKVGMLQFSGLTVVYDTAKEPNERILSATLADGSPLDSDKLYKVVTNDFLASGGDGYPCFTTARNREDTGIDVQDILIDQLQQKQPLTVTDDERFTLLNNPLDNNK
ncbi:MAG: 5'-nucleotidase C-terminal domain-containing protein [Sporomusaceae bacterium]|nr:5'-nucleotidase C-terminal domain-containing protein [Sporomusaceae bacterium]